MTRTTRLAAWLAFAAIASPTVIAQRQAQQPQAEWQRLHGMGLKHRTALDLYQTLKQAARGGQVSPPFSQLPDWSGVWTISGFGSFVTPGPGGIAPKLTQAAQQNLKELEDRAAKGAKYQENISDCGPPGFPMWLNIPFLREFIVRPEQTWLSSETVNNVRRIYTDGRGHPPAEDAFPLYYGDSIGFWDNQKLVIHTTQLMARGLEVTGPNQSAEMETVEIWENTTPQTVEAKVWLYDPSVYLEPWYTTRSYTRVANADKSLRMNYWHCGENPNNEVVKTPDGSTQYRDFQFTDKDNR